ncbi:MAG: malonyl-CoA decarboxylase family protein [Magnetococcales bacterium]|nr:malonyl-CoA decarboxylase family protein [Magnetococcales bacterium]
MRQTWWDKVINSVADRGRELLNLNASEPSIVQLRQMCRDLLRGSGEARGTALAREVVRTLEGMESKVWDDFLEMLNVAFGPDPVALGKAVEAYRQDPGADTLLRLRREVEPPRQELFRRLNLAPGGTYMLVRLRARLLKAMVKKPDLKMVDADLKHLFASWFNRGFLELKHISWNSSALILEKLANYESVQPIRSLQDLRRRLERDRRCYAFFHPALPDEPLIFVEVALMEGIPAEATGLLNPKGPILAPEAADSAIFYSINNCQDGLRGISFGNFLIKQVTAELGQQLPNLKHFATFSPMPGFAETLMRTDAEAPFTEARLKVLLAEEAAGICQASGEKDVVKGFRQLLKDPDQTWKHLSGALELVALAYLAMVKRGKSVFDPVAFFHLANGACLDRINPAADPSKERWKASFGVMVNYRYEIERVEKNHEGFMTAGKMALSRSLSKKLKQVQAAWGGG